MTAVADRQMQSHLWSAMPGWGIVADLTPPELIATRRLHVLKRLLAIGLGFVLALCVGGYVLAFLRDSSASDAVDAANSQTLPLTHSLQKYAVVTQIQQQTGAIDAQRTSLMSTDIDMSTLVARMRRILPGTMSVTSLTVSSTPAVGTGTGGTPSLDTSGRPVVGSVTLTGRAQHLVDLATYVIRLQELRGVVNVIPSSNAGGDLGGQWSVNLQLNDLVYTHRFDAGKIGSK